LGRYISNHDKLTEKQEAYGSKIVDLAIEKGFVHEESLKLSN